MRKIGKSDDAEATDTHGFLQHGLRVSQVLQGVNLQHHIKTLITKHGQTLFQIELNNVDASVDAGQHIGVIYLYPITRTTMVLL